MTAQLRAGDRFALVSRGVDCSRNSICHTLFKIKPNFGDCEEYALLFIVNGNV